MPQPGNHKNISTAELSEWVKLYTKDLFTWAYRKTSNRELSEDLVQETFLAAAESAAKFKRESQPKTWLMGILKNKIAAYYRKSMQSHLSSASSLEDLPPFFNSEGRWEKAQRPQSWTGEPAHLMDNPDFNRIFDGCIEHLPELMEACVRLKYLDAKKGAEICQELGLTTTNYWQLIHRAKLRLRECLENSWFRK